jgi:hypothetical protein
VQGVSKTNQIATLPTKSNPNSNPLQHLGRLLDAIMIVRKGGARLIVVLQKIPGKFTQCSIFPTTYLKGDGT